MKSGMPIISKLGSLIELGMRLRLLNDPNSPRSNDSDGRIHSSYSPSHPKAGQRLILNPREDTHADAGNMIDAWRSMEWYLQSLLGLILTSFVLFVYLIGGAVVIMAIIGFPLLILVLTNFRHLKIMISKLITR